MISIIVAGGIILYVTAVLVVARRLRSSPLVIYGRPLPLRLGSRLLGRLSQKIPTPTANITTTAGTARTNINQAWLMRG
jgi:hypothetical protein